MSARHPKSAFPDFLPGLSKHIALLILTSGTTVSAADLVHVPGSAVWDLEAPVWNDGSAVWTNSSDVAVFSSATGGQVSVADVTAADPRGIFGGRILIQTSEYELISAVAGGVKMQMSQGTAVEVRPGATAILDNIAFTASGDGTTISGGGTFHLTNHADFWRTSSGQLRIGGGTTVRLTDNANLGGPFLGNTIIVGNTGNGSLHVDGGTVSVGNGTQNRSLIVGAAATAVSANVTLDSGSIWIKPNATSALVLGTSAMGSNQAEFHLNGGVLRTPGVRSEGGNARFVFNGGTLQTLVASSSLFEGVSEVLVGQQPARLSSGDGFGGFVSEMRTPLRRDPALGDDSDGGLIKSDFGAIRLAPGGNYRGDTVVERGVLTLPDPALSSQSTVHLGNNGILELDFGGLMEVDKLYINGQPQAAGTWGGEGSGASHVSPNFRGSGVLQVRSAGPALPVLVPSQGPWLGRDWDQDLLATIPDPLVTNDGRQVTTAAEWVDERREEVLHLFKEHVYGHNAVESPQQMTFAAGAKESVFGGKATRQRVDIQYTGPGGTGGFSVYIHFPTSGNPKGIFLYIGPNPGSSTNNSSYPAEAATDRGYVVAGFQFSDLAADNETSGLKSGVFNVFGPTGTWQNERYPDRPANAWSVIGAWAWGASRCIDYFKSNADLKSLPIAVVGHSRRGKAALWCGAQDTRVDLTIPNSSGSTGAAMARLKGGERVAKINGDFAHWFCDNYKEFNNREEEMPVDQHMLVALCAPRLVYVQSSYTDYWADPNAEYESCLQAGPVYDLFGLDVVASRARPAANVLLHDGSIGYHARGGEPDGSHRLTAWDWHRFMDYADLHFPHISDSLKTWRKSNGLHEHGTDDFQSSGADGVSNLMKYALNIPLSSLMGRPMPMGGTAGLPAFESDDQGIGFQFVRRRAETVPGIRYVAERTADFQTWNRMDEPASVVPVNTAWERVTFRDPIGVPHQHRMFYRLRILK